MQRELISIPKMLLYALVTVLVYVIQTSVFGAQGQWLPECIAIAVTAGLHLWRRNSLLSIAGGTITYMLLVQVVFA